MMRQVRQSFEELRVGDSIRLKGRAHNVRITAKFAHPLLVIAGNGMSERIEYSSYDYTLIEDWINSGNLRYIAFRLPIEKLRVDMQVAVCNRTSCYSILSVKGGQITLEDGPHESTFAISYVKEYNYSLLLAHEAAELVDDPLEKLAFQILAGDPMALDAAKDVLKC